jgi:hypothetical protein
MRGGGAVRVCLGGCGGAFWPTLRAYEGAGTSSTAIAALRQCRNGESNFIMDTAVTKGRVKMASCDAKEVYCRNVDPVNLFLLSSELRLAMALYELAIG